MLLLQISSKIRIRIVKVMLSTTQQGQPHWNSSSRRHINHILSVSHEHKYTTTCRCKAFSFTRISLVVRDVVRIRAYADSHRISENYVYVHCKFTRLPERLCRRLHCTLLPGKSIIRKPFSLTRLQSFYAVKLLT